MIKVGSDSLRPEADVPMPDAIKAEVKNRGGVEPICRGPAQRARLPKEGRLHPHAIPAPTPRG